MNFSDIFCKIKQMGGTSFVSCLHQCHTTLKSQRLSHEKLVYLNSQNLLLFFLCLVTPITLLISSLPFASQNSSLSPLKLSLGLAPEGEHWSLSWSRRQLGPPFDLLVCHFSHLQCVWRFKLSWTQNLSLSLIS